MQNATSSKKWKRKTKGSNEPTDHQFWRQAAETKNVPQPKQNLDSKQQLKNLKKIHTTNLSNPSAANDPIFKDANNDTTSPVGNDQKVSKENSNKTIIKNTREGKPNAQYYSDSSGQSIPPNTSGQLIRSGISGQTIRPDIAGQTIPPVISGQPVRPGKLYTPKNQPKPNFAASVRPPNKQNLDTKRQLRNPKKIHTTDLSNPSAANEPVFKDENNESTSPVVNDKKVSQENSNKSIIKNTSKGKPDAQYLSGSSGQSIPSNTSGQTIRPGISGQTIRPGISGQTIRPDISGQTIPPVISGQTIRPGIFGQTIRAGISGQPVRPGKLYTPKNQPKPNFAASVRPPNKQNLDTKRQLKNLKEIYTTDLSNPSAANEPIFEDKKNCDTTSTVGNDRKVSQENSNKAIIKNTSEGKPDAQYCSGSSGQSIPPNTSGQIIRPGISGHPIGSGISGQLIRPGISGQTIRPSISGQTNRPDIAGQTIPPVISGQPVRPGKLYTFKNQPKPNFAASICPPNKQNLDTKRQLKNLKEIHTTDLSNPSAANEPIFKAENNESTSPVVNDKKVSQENSNKAIIKNTSEGKPDAQYFSGSSGQSIPSITSGQTIRPGISGQTIRPGISGQTIPPVISGHTIRPGIFGQTIRPGISGQTIPPVISGQPIRPGKLYTPKNHTKPNLINLDASVRPPIKLNPNLINISNNSDPGPKFKPLQEVAYPKLVTNINISKQVPQPTNKEQAMLQNTENPIITIVGKQRANSTNQQKKILKFQMKMKAMQQEKARQAQAQPHANMPNVPGTVNTFNNPNVGFANTPGMGFGMGPQNPFATHNPIGIQHPMVVAPPAGVPNPVEMQQNIVGDHNRSFTPPIPGATGKRNKAGKRNKPPIPSAPNMHQNQNNSIAIPLTPVPTTTPQQPELVETAFQMGCDRSLTPPINQKPTNPRKQQISPKPVHIQSGRGPKYPLEPYACAYPKGIPRSFLVQQQNANYPHTIDHVGQIWPSYPTNQPTPVPPVGGTMNPLMVETGGDGDMPQPYSPSELYNDMDLPMGADYDDPDSPEHSQSGSKRLSAFRRLGPQTQPKKPKLTISVTVNEDQEVRAVVDETEEQEQEITPVHLREDILLSNDEIVKKYLKTWPWKRNVVVKKNVTARSSKTVMMLELEQMEEIYNRETLFLQVTVRGYPSSWKKEDVLDTLMEVIRGYSFIPCFIEFNREECKFLTLRCRSALLSLHKCGFIIRKEEVELTITIAQTELTLTHLDFVPRLVLRKRLMMCSDESVMDLNAFTLKEDISHFIYFPLNRLNNQMELVDMLHSEAAWCHLTELNLSHNRITSLDGFELEHTVPRLKHLNLSYNCLEKITSLLKCRSLPLKSIHLEGNPLCRNYIDPDQYVKVVKMMFSGVNTIDDVPIPVKGQKPKFHRNYCPADATELADKFLQVYFSLLDEDMEQRKQLQDMYESTANMTITYNYKMAFSPIYRCFKSLFAHARQIEEGRVDIIKGSAAIVKTITSWPHTEHDPYTFTVDVMYHSGSTTIIRIDGILKLTRETLAEDEHLLAFSRTVVLHTKDTVEYKIQAETLYWSNPVGAYGRSAFAITTVKTKQYPKIDSTTDEELQKELLKIFMTLTTMNKKVSERCLELKKWNLREALDHFTKLWKLDNLESLTKEVL